jgi:hypothetical protein
MMKERRVKGFEREELGGLLLYQVSILMKNSQDRSA